MSPETQHTINKIAAICANQLANLEPINRGEQLTYAERNLSEAKNALLAAHDVWINEDSDEAMAERCPACVPLPPGHAAAVGPVDVALDQIATLARQLDDVEANAEVGW